MKRELVRVAQETLEFCKTGHYTFNGHKYNLGLPFSLSGTKIISQFPKHTPVSKSSTKIQCFQESTIQGIQALQGQGKIICLNFASAKRPGGGFRSGSNAQEESLAYSSSLYPTLLKCTEFYSQKYPDNTYSDDLILSPHITFFRDRFYRLTKPAFADVISIAAPNASAIQHHVTRADIICRRIRNLLTIARQEKVDHLVLGAWGCGVFKNDPAIVASCFKTCLQEFNFQSVRFSILGPTIKHFDPLVHK